MSLNFDELKVEIKIFGKKIILISNHYPYTKVNITIIIKLSNNIKKSQTPYKAWEHTNYDYYFILTNRLHVSIAL